MYGKKYLFCILSSGFNDVLCQLYRTLEYAKAYNRILVVDTRSGCFADDLSTYFTLDEKNVILRPTKNLLLFFDTLSTYPPELQGQCSKISTFKYPSFSYESDQPYKEDLLIHFASGGGYVGHKCLHKMRLLPEVALEISRSLTALGNDYDAIHIRNTDIGTDYLPFFHKISPKVRGRTLLICSDDHACREAAKKIFDQSHVVTVSDIPDTGGHPLHLIRESARTRNLAMLTDLFALAQARRLFITRLTRDLHKKLAEVSGFSALASLLNQNKKIVYDLFTSLPKKSSYIFRKQKLYIEKMRKIGVNIACINEQQHAQAVHEMVKLITPMNVRGGQKIRIGGEKDGGYVMLDPGRDGIAYSLGVSSHSPWDLEMAERGFKVYQYDGSIDHEPDQHPNIFFHKCFIGTRGNENAPCRSFSEVIQANQHEEEKNLILQMDIEGAEWEVFEELTEDDLLRFSQIIVELHNVDLRSYKKYTLLDKIRRTHTPVHVHYNNYSADEAVFNVKNGFIYSGNLIEVSYVRTQDHAFEPCHEYFPTALDRPNVNQYPEIPIGFFDLAPLAPISSPPVYIPTKHYSAFTMEGQIPVFPMYFNDTRPEPIHISAKLYENTLRKITNDQFSYYDNTLYCLYSALKEYDISGSTVLIFGLAGCNCDALAIWKKAKKILVVDYNTPKCDHPDVFPLTYEELRNSGEKADFAFSISSFEHDGLGRYGDPINPDGDMEAMRSAKEFVKPGGIMFFAVPIGRDSLFWNAHRIYGPKRLPLLLREWNCVDSFGHASFQTTNIIQPVLILQNTDVSLPCVPKKTLLSQLTVYGKKTVMAENDKTNTRNLFLPVQIDLFTKLHDLLPSGQRLSIFDGESIDAWARNVAIKYALLEDEEARFLFCKKIIDAYATGKKQSANSKH